MSWQIWKNRCPRCRIIRLRPFAYHILEHVVNFLPPAQGTAPYRRTRRAAGGRFAPFSNPYGYSDPTHVRFFGLYSFYYFSDESDQRLRKIPAFYLPERFVVESVSITLMPTLLLVKPIRRLATKFFNSSLRVLDWFERSWCRRFPADSIRYVLRVKKPSDS